MPPGLIQKGTGHDGRHCECSPPTTGTEGGECLPWSEQSHQGGGGIANADHIGAGFHLRPRKAHPHRKYELEKVAHKNRIVVEVHHKRVDAA